MPRLIAMRGRARRSRPAFCRAALALCLLVLLPATFGADAGARSAASTGAVDGVASVADGPSAEEIEALVADLEDPERRAVLLARLRALRAVAEADEDDVGRAALSVESLLDASEALVTEAARDLRNTPPREILRRGVLTGLVLALGVLAHLLAGHLLARVSRGFVEWTRNKSEIALEQEQEEQTPAALFEGLPRRLVSFAVLLASIVAVLDIWNLRLADWVRSALGGNLVRDGLTLLLFGVVTLVLWVLADTLIDGLVRVQLGKRVHPRRRDRLQTVAPLARGVVRFLVGGTGLLLMLSAVGIDVTPVLASAGIVGLAIGFGAQSLVRDLLNGATLVVEDACSVEDWVEIGGHAGLVEHMGLRAMRLRDLSGTVHFIPYSEVGTVRNYTQRFAYAWLDVPVAYEADLEEVFALAEAVGREIRHDPAFMYRVLADPEVFGLTELGERGPVVTIRMKTLSMERWAVGREYRKRLKERLDAAGLPVPDRQLRVHTRDAEAGREEGAERSRALRAAASEG